MRMYLTADTSFMMIILAGVFFNKLRNEGEAEIQRLAGSINLRLKGVKLIGYGCAMGAVAHSV